jgi:hypothetical protein
VAAIAIAAGMSVDALAGVPLSFPTYEGILVNAAALAALELGLTVTWQAHRLEGAWPGNVAAASHSMPVGSERSTVNAGTAR